jgi:predicted deacylase
VHGREHSGIQAAYALVEGLAAITDLRGTVEILPVVNPASFDAETRENPLDGRNLGECFTPPPSASAADGKDRGRQELSQSEAIARAVLSRLDRADHLLDLHSAGEARYLPHAVFFREQDAPSAAASGLPFAMLRRRTREGRTTGTLSHAAFQRGIPALALELGGGITTYPEDIERGVRAILSLLAFWGYLAQRYGLRTTPADRVCVEADRKFIRAWEEGAFYPSCTLADIVARGRRLGTWISLQQLGAAPVTAVESGVLVYLRTRCRTHRGDTLAMLLPEGSVAGTSEE